MRFAWRFWLGLYGGNKNRWLHRWNTQRINGDIKATEASGKQGGRFIEANSTIPWILAQYLGLV